MKSTGIRKEGFTIVELLTVMGVIAVLIGLLVPALNMVKDFSKQLQQKAQFHSIEVGLEMFKNDFGIYPESNDNNLQPQNLIDNTIYCGTNKLAEAMVGWDLLGYHPKSGLTATGVNNIDSDLTPDDIYVPFPPGLVSTDGTYEETPEENIDIRKKYIELEHANAFKMEDVYQNYGGFVRTNFVLCDVYSKRRHSGKKTGMPILYWRARTKYKFQDYLNTASGGSATNPAQNDDIYNFWDNANLLNLNDPETGTIHHPLYTGVPLDDLETFEDMILNKQVQDATITALNPNGIKRPYRDDSFILLSAGKDGLFGTSDDLLNFTKEPQ